MLLPDSFFVNLPFGNLSSLVRNVPLFTSLEVSPFFVFAVCHWDLRRSAALRRGLGGASRAKRRRRSQCVLIFAPATAVFFFPHGLPATDGSGRACLFHARQARGAALPLGP